MTDQATFFGARPAALRPVDSLILRLRYAGFSSGFHRLRVFGLRIAAAKMRFMDADERALIRQTIAELRELAEATSRAVKNGQGMLAKSQREIEQQRRAVETNAILRRQPWRRNL